MCNSERGSSFRSQLSQSLQLFFPLAFTIYTHAYSQYESLQEMLESIKFYDAYITLLLKTSGRNDCAFFSIYVKTIKWISVPKKQDASVETNRISTSSIFLNVVFRIMIDEAPKS